MAARPSDETQTFGAALTDNTGGLDRAITVLKTGEQMASKVRDEARKGVHRLIEGGPAALPEHMLAAALQRANGIRYRRDRNA